MHPNTRSERFRPFRFPFPTTLFTNTLLAIGSAQRVMRKGSNDFRPTSWHYLGCCQHLLETLKKRRKRRCDLRPDTNCIQQQTQRPSRVKTPGSSVRHALRNTAYKVLIPLRLAYHPLVGTPELQLPQNCLRMPAGQVESIRAALGTTLCVRWTPA